MTADPPDHDTSDAGPSGDSSAALFRVIVVAAGIALVVLALALRTITGSSRSMMNARDAERENGNPAESFSIPPPTVAELARTPVWIWAAGEPADDETTYFRRTLPLETPPSRVTLRFACDNEATVLVDGEAVISSSDWRAATEADLTPFAARGAFTVDIHARNEDGPAGLIAVIELEAADGATERIVTDRTWMVSDSADLRDPRPATEVALYGAPPWGAIPGLLGDDVKRDIETRAGFVTELVYAVPRREGSWVSLAVDPRGRLIASDQSRGLYRITPAPVGTDRRATAVEPIDVPVGAAQGLLCVGDDLYCMAHGDRADGPGLYRVRDTDGDDRYDAYTLLRRIEGAGEHGPHGIAAGPDGLLYVVAGNHTPPPDPEESAVPRRWDEDHLLPRLWDANGHAVGITAPGGWVCVTDPDGASWRLFAIGFRNPYDLAFNRDGELFTYDADMEWDMGAPWYRPTRVNHVVSGADYGWRSGTAKWPPHYADSLPAVLDIGPGSPTGVLFGTGARFPRRYREALFLLDWTFGTIHAVHLEPDGATYRGEREVFLSGRPLPLADAVINPTDGAMYFVVGGRGVPSALYRVRWTGTEADDEAHAHAPAPAHTPAHAPAHTPAHTDAPAHAHAHAPAHTNTHTPTNTRRRLEAAHLTSDASGLDDAWPMLGHPDRFVRHAARVAVEQRPVSTWSRRALDEPVAPAAMTALIAAARCVGPTDQRRLIAALRRFDWDDLDREQRLTWLRAWALCFIRTGQPPAADRATLADDLADVYPTGDDMTDRELCDLLVYLRSPTVVARTIPLMERSDTHTAAHDETLLARNDTYGAAILKMASAPPQRQQVHYALALRHAKRGWTPALRDRYFRWFETARRTSGGLSFVGFLDRIREDALANVPPADRARLAAIGTTEDALVADAPAPRGPGRQWTTDAVVAIARGGLDGGRDFENGRRMYAAASCAKCHRFAGAGRAGGPDLTLLSSRYSIRDLAESIVEPSRTISDQYEDTEFVLDDETVIIGRVVGRDGSVVQVMPSRLDPDAVVEIGGDRVVAERASAVSPMMPGLLDRLGEDEVLDLFAYLLSEGDARSAMFGP